MLKELQYTIGAVARKDVEESLCHLEIRDGRAIAYGGRIAMSTPINCPFNVRPHARSLVKAVQACKNDDIALSMTAGGRLTVKAGKFRSHVDCLPNDKEMPQLRPSGQFFEVTKDFIDAIKVLAPFMSIDASRPWAQGLMIGEQSIFATNNIILAQRWHGASFPKRVVIPEAAVTELIRVDDVPQGVQFDDHSLTFYFGKGRWLCTHLIAEPGGWEQVHKIFDAHTAPEGLEEIKAEFYDALDTLKPFLTDTGNVYLRGDKIATTPNDDEGTTIETPVANGPIFKAAQLRLLDGVATKINFGTYPKPSYFIGNKLRGIIVGIRE